jgi:hypothetical protein
VNSELQILVAGGGIGSVILGGIAIHERQQTLAARRSMERHSLRFPMSLDPAAAKLGLSALTGLLPGTELVFEVSATSEGIRHAVHIPQAVKASVVSGLTAAIPALRIKEEPLQQSGSSRIALRAYLPTPSALAGENPGSTLRMLAGLHLRGGESVAVRWGVCVAAPGALKASEPSDSAGKEVARIWQQKTKGAAGFRIAGLVLVAALSSARARALVGQISTILRTQRGPVGGLRLTSERSGRSMASLPYPTRRSGWANPVETLPLLMWPLGEAVPGVEVGAARELRVPAHVPRTGGLHLITGRGRDGKERPVVLSDEAASMHLAIFGPTGSGKSSALGRIVLNSLVAGVGGVLIDPKDLTGDILNRVPPEFADRVVVLDPLADPVIGLDLFGAGNDPSLRSDTILSALKGISDGWGPRIDQFLRLGLNTAAAALTDPVVSDWLRLYSDRNLRAAAVAKLDDPIAIAEWRTYENALSPAEQTQFIMPAASRISNLLSRPALRGVLNQPRPKLNIGRLLEERKWLLISVNPGVLGEPVAYFLTAIAAYLTWAAVESRAAVAPERRHPVRLVFDELQSLANLPIGLPTFFERTRSMNCGVVCATQAASRLPESTRHSLFGNVGSLLTFTAGADEAARLARELPGVSAEDVMSLGRYECALRINTAGLGSGSAVVTGHTEPLPPVTGHAEAIRARTAERYGRDRREIDAELRRRIEGDPGEDEGSLGRARRAS